jgi:hypothetical protein
VRRGVDRGKGGRLPLPLRGPPVLERVRVRKNVRGSVCESERERERERGREREKCEKRAYDPRELRSSEFHGYERERK